MASSLPSVGFSNSLFIPRERPTKQVKRPAPASASIVSVSKGILKESEAGQESQAKRQRAASRVAPRIHFNVDPESSNKKFETFMPAGYLPSFALSPAEQLPHLQATADSKDLEAATLLKKPELNAKFGLKDAEISNFSSAIRRMPSSPEKATKLKRLIQLRDLQIIDLLKEEAQLVKEVEAPKMTPEVELPMARSKILMLEKELNNHKRRIASLEFGHDSTVSSKREIAELKARLKAFEEAPSVEFYRTCFQGLASDYEWLLNKLPGLPVPKPNRAADALHWDAVRESSPVSMDSSEDDLPRVSSFDSHLQQAEELSQLKKTLNDRVYKIGELTLAVSDKEKELAQQKEELTKVREAQAKMHLEHEKQVRALNADLEKSKAEKEKLTKEKQNKSRVTQFLDKELTQRQADLAKYKAELEELNIAQRCAQEGLDEALVKIAKAKQEIEDLQKKNEESRDESEEKVRQLEESQLKVAQLQKELDLSNGKVKDLEKELEEKNSKVKTVKAHVKILAGNLEAANAQRLKWIELEANRSQLVQDEIYSLGLVRT